MKKIKVKTGRERTFEEESKMKEIKVKDTGFDYFVCRKCKVAFLDDDIILRDNVCDCRCPQMIQIFWRNRRCLEILNYGSKETFDKYYKVIENKK